MCALKLGKLFNAQNKNRRAADCYLDRFVRHHRPHLTHVRERPEHFAPLAADVVNDRLDPRHLMVFDADDKGRVAFTQEAAARGKFGRTEPALTERILQLSRVSVLNDGHDEFHTHSLARPRCYGTVSAVKDKLVKDRLNEARSKA